MTLFLVIHSRNAQVIAQQQYMIEAFLRYIIYNTQHKISIYEQCLWAYSLTDRDHRTLVGGEIWWGKLCCRKQC